MWFNKFKLKNTNNFNYTLKLNTTFHNTNPTLNTKLISITLNNKNDYFLTKKNSIISILPTPIGNKIKFINNYFYSYKFYNKLLNYQNNLNLSILISSKLSNKNISYINIPKNKTIKLLNFNNLFTFIPNNFIINKRKKYLINNNNNNTSNIILSHHGNLNIINLKDINDKILINKNYLLIIDGISIIDINNSISKFNLIPNDNNHSNIIQKCIHFLFYKFNNTNNNFLQISGPRNIYIQSNYNTNFKFNFNSFFNKNKNKNTNNISIPFNNTHNTNLNYAYIDKNNNNNIIFKSTDKFTLK